MKINKYILGAMAGIAALFTSCSDKGYWDEYSDNEVKYSFEQPTFNGETEFGPAEFTINVMRTKTVGEATVPVTVSNATEGMSFSTSAHFADGENAAPLKISIDEALPGHTYKAVLKFADDLKSPAGSASCTVDISVILTWKSLGTGIFIDWFATGQDFEAEVEILKAEGVDRWRVMHPYDAGMAVDSGEWGNALTGNYPEYIEFWDNGDGSLDFKPFYTGLVYEGDPANEIWAYPGNAKTNGGAQLNGTVENNVWYMPNYACLSPFYYIDGVGGFNNTTVFGCIQIILPDFSE